MIKNRKIRVDIASGADGDQEQGPGGAGRGRGRPREEEREDRTPSDWRNAPREGPPPSSERPGFRSERGGDRMDRGEYKEILLVLICVNYVLLFGKFLLFKYFSMKVENHFIDGQKILPFPIISHAFRQHGWALRRWFQSQGARSGSRWSTREKLFWCSERWPFEWFFFWPRS